MWREKKGFFGCEESHGVRRGENSGTGVVRRKRNVLCAYMEASGVLAAGRRKILPELEALEVPGSWCASSVGATVFRSFFPPPTPRELRCEGKPNPGGAPWRWGSLSLPKARRFRV